MGRWQDELVDAELVEDGWITYRLRREGGDAANQPILGCGWNELHKLACEVTELRRKLAEAERYAFLVAAEIVRHEPRPEKAIRNLHMLAEAKREALLEAAGIPVNVPSGEPWRLTDAWVDGTKDALSAYRRALRRMAVESQEQVDD